MSMIEIPEYVVKIFAHAVVQEMKEMNRTESLQSVKDEIDHHIDWYKKVNRTEFQNGCLYGLVEALSIIERCEKEER